MPAPRMTLPTQLVIRELLADPERPRYGLELCAAAGLPSGTIHPILARLTRYGWVVSEWETIDPSEVGRPRRRYYWLAPDSVAAVRSALRRAEAGTDALRKLRPHLAGGES